MAENEIPERQEAAVSIERHEEVQAIIDRMPIKGATWVAFMLRKITLYDFMRQRELIEVYR